jgi:hypothetical protein
MSYFYGEIRANNNITRRASAKSLGLRVVASTAQGAVVVLASHNKKTGKDNVKVTLMPWGKGTRHHVKLYSGAVTGMDDEKAVDDAMFSPGFVAWRKNTSRAPRKAKTNRA